jgi:hypothetical protein
MSSLDDDGIDQLCERLNTESEKERLDARSTKVPGLVTKALARRFFADFNRVLPGKRVSVLKVEKETPIFEVTALKLNLNFGGERDAYECLERVFVKLAKKLRPRSPRAQL